MSESASGEADDSTLSNTKKERFECKTCGSVFIEYPSQTKGWCSRDCYYDSVDMHGENNPNYSGGNVTVECIVCEDNYEVRPSKEDKTRFCSRSCKGNWMSSEYTGVDNPSYGIKRPVGSNHPSWNGGLVKTKCANCGEVVKRKRNEYERYENQFCSQECRATVHAKRFHGEDHPNWKENTSDERFYQTEEWKEIRQRALDRVGGVCEYCGSDSQLIGHHIIPIAEGGAKLDIDNVCILCRGCHNTWEGLYIRPDFRQ